MRVNVCPRCGMAYKEYPAISRADNKTPICPECGVEEAAETVVCGTVTPVKVKRQEIEEQRKMHRQELLEKAIAFLDDNGLLLDFIEDQDVDFTEEDKRYFCTENL